MHPTRRCLVSTSRGPTFKEMTQETLKITGMQPGVLLGAGGMPAQGVRLVILHGGNFRFRHWPEGASIATLSARPHVTIDGKTIDPDLKGRARLIAATERELMLPGNPARLSAVPDGDVNLRLAGQLKGRARFVAAQTKDNAARKT